MKNLIFCSALFFLASFISAQPAVEWQRAFGGSKNDSPYAIQSTSDGGSVMAGLTYSTDGDVSLNHGERDFWVVKLDGAGNLQWEKALGGTSYDIAKAIRQTSDGGYIAVGEVFSSDGDVTNTHVIPDCWVVKLTSEGDIQWQKSFGGSNYDGATCVQQTMDGGYIIGAVTGSTDGDVTGNHGAHDIWLIKLSATGGIQWQKTFGGSSNDALTSIQQITDGGFLIGGQTSSNDGDVSGFHGMSDIWIVKLNEMGEMEWQKALGGSMDSYPGAAISTSDGGYIIAGVTKAIDGDVSGNHGFSDAWIVKLSDIGQVAWQKTLGGSLNDGANSIQQTNDSGFILSGSTKSNDGNVSGNHGDTDIWIVKLGGNGEILWQKTLGGSKHEASAGVIQTQDQGYILTGQSDSNDGNMSGNHGDFDCWVVKLSPESVGVNTPDAPDARFLELFPNPASHNIFLKTGSEQVAIDVRVFDAQGQMFSRQTIRNGADLNVTNLPDGVYTVVVTTGSGKIYSNIFRKQQ